MTETERPLLLASVVLLRLHDYGNRTVAEQARLSAQLDAVLAVLLHDFPVHERIVLDGNGCAAVAVLGNAPAALRLSERALEANVAGLGLSIGIDHGPVEIATGDAGKTLTGDVVSRASVIAAFAAGFGLLASDAFRITLAEALPGSEAALVPVGLFSDSALRSYQLFRADRIEAQKRRRRFILAATGIVLALLAISVAVRVIVPERPRPLASMIDPARFPALNKMVESRNGCP